MTQPRDPRSEQAIQSYLDGRLRGQELAMFERRLSTDRDLTDLIAQHRQIDQSLHRLLSPPSAASLRKAALPESLLQQAASIPIRPAAPARMPWRSRLAVAASVAALLIGGWMLYLGLRPQPPYSQEYRSMEAAYQHKIDTGFKPAWRCDNDEDLRRSFQEEFFQPMLLASLPAGVEALGLDYTNTISRNTLIMLARADGQPLVVFIDRAVNDAGQRFEPPPGKRLFRRELGTLILYEFTPLEQPVLLDKFYIPESCEKDMKPPAAKDQPS